ncbi:MAG: hypothetical protein ACOH13_13865 [Flavobacteriales bacterium]
MGSEVPKGGSAAQGSVYAEAIEDTMENRRAFQIAFPRIYLLFAYVPALFLSSCQGDPQSKVNTWIELIAETGASTASDVATVDRPSAAETDVQLTARLGGISYLDTARIVHIATTLYNPSSDTVRFISMDCSYEDMFLVGGNDNYVIRSRYDCFKNWAIVQVLPPKTYLDQFIQIAPLDKNTRGHHGRLKIGMFWLVPTTNQDIFSAYMHRKESAQVIWSNELDLEHLYRDPYK